MIHKAWSSIEEVPYCFWGLSVKFLGHTAKKIVDFDPNWAFPDCNSNLNSPMGMKCCTKLEVALKRRPIVFQGHPSAGLGRVPDLRVRVQVRVLVICVSPSTSLITWLLHEYELWVRVLVDEYEYEYRPMIYILYKQQYCIFKSLKRESSDSYKPGKKL